MAILLGSNLWRSRVVLKRAQWRKTHQPRSRLVSTLPRLSIIEALVRHEPRTIAVKHSMSQDQFEYGRLLHDVTKGIDYLSRAVGSESIQGARIGLLVENGYNFVGSFYGFHLCEIYYLIIQSSCTSLDPRRSSHSITPFIKLSG